MIYFLCAAAATAGFFDAIAGGGGLIQLPSLLLGLNDKPEVSVLGTNKFAAIFGTANAANRYRKKINIDKKMLAYMAIPAFFGSMGGAQLASRVPTDNLRVGVFIALVIIFIYSLLNPKLGHEESVKLNYKVAALSGLSIGFYDGIFGPGTGSFIALILVAVIGFAFLEATAMTKIVNWGTNLAAIITFQLTGHIIWAIGLALGAANLTGALLGVRVAVKGGSALIRKAFIAVVFLLILRLGYDIVKS